MTTWERRLKWAIDLVVAGGVLLATFPLILLRILIATIDTRRWGLFAQARVGREGKTFSLY
jgi:lipopolysaccharide/colanic/teichoic acid biosynthesis glycosyltransferase